ncbi:hypothetical protein G6F22_014842 [Rhizopus arrhizus]|nr:hypothetical protein G6F22_014842 [Rhizopus arrhizus]
MDFPACGRGIRRRTGARGQMRQRLQHIASAAGRANQPCSRRQRQQQAQPLAEHARRTRARRQGVERPQHHGRHHRQERPTRHLHPGRHHGDEHPPRSRQQQHAEQALHAIHPGARLGQQRAGGRPHDQQRHAHAPGHGEQRRPTQDHVARLRDIQQRTRQRRGYARPDDQRRQGAHHERTGITPARNARRTLRQLRLDARRHLERERVKHRQCQHGQQDGEQRQDPRRLQPRGQARAAQSCGHAERGVDHRHAQHIGRRQRQSAAARRPGLRHAAQHD